VNEAARSRLLAWQGRPHEALDVMAWVPEAAVSGDHGLLALRAGLLAVSGQPWRALRDLASLPADLAAAALRGRLLDAVARGATAVEVQRAEERLAFVRAGGVPAEAMRLGVLMAACELDLGRVREARAGLETVARESAAAGAPGLGVMARALHAAWFVTSDADRRDAADALAEALDAADPAADPLSFAVGSAVRCTLLAALRREAEARDVATRAAEVLTGLLGATGAAVGAAISTACRTG
jgi:hypothetical protein